MTDEDVQWLREQVQRQADVEDIKQLKARYCRYADGQEWEKWGQLLTEDFHFDSDGGTQDGRDNVVAFVSKSLGGASTVHHCHTPEITITGPDTATGIWAMQDHVKMVHNGTQIMFRGQGTIRRSTSERTKAGRSRAPF